MSSVECRSLFLYNIKQIEFHVAMCLFSNRSQMASKCCKNISDTLCYHLTCHFFVLTTFWRHLWCCITEQTNGQHGIFLLNIQYVQLSWAVLMVFLCWAWGVSSFITLCCWTRHFTVAVSLFTHKWVPGNLLPGVALQWTSWSILCMFQLVLPVFDWGWTPMLISMGNFEKNR